MQRRRHESLFWCDEGFSTVGMAIALLLTLSLVFTCARVYEVNTQAAQVQEVADACALAAENVVAEFYIVVTACDALVFTLSLTSTVAIGLGVVCACLPPLAPLSKALVEAGVKIGKARDSFYDAAKSSLEQLQRALPYLANLEAQEVMRANTQGQASYQGVVILSPWEAEEIEGLSFEAGNESGQEAQEGADELSSYAQEAEEAAEEANAWKQHAYEHDSGSKTEYCMYERAASLAGMQGSQNPFFSSVDTWNFQAALSRARAYYPLRLAREAPTGTSAEAQADSELRKRFYTYAIKEVSKGYVNETETSFDAYFPLLPKNTAEMRETELYTEVAYPLTRNAEGLLVCHAWSGCPGMADGEAAGMGSIQGMDGAEGYATCPECEFTVSSMGKVAAASTSISNGFEHHYNEVARAAEEYERARATLDPLTQKAKQLADGLFDKVGAALSETFSKRLEIDPPGHAGAVALVADLSSPSSAFPSSFVVGGGTLGARAAVSAAALVKESSEEGENVISALLDGFDAGDVGAGQAASLILDLWSGLLGVYAQGHDALVEAVGAALGSIPLTSASGLGAWAASSLSDAIEAVGFAPPDLRARKAALVNSVHVLEEGESAATQGLLQVREAALVGGGVGISGALSAVEARALASIEGLSSSFTIATVVLFDGLVEIPLTLSLPDVVAGGLSGVVQEGIDYLRGIAGQVTGVRSWR